MTNDKRDLLEVLKAELEFLEKGGYRHTARAAWRPHFMFQDSPTCLNFDPTQPPRPCTDCILMQLVPADARSEKIPCRHIPLSEHGETIDSFYRTGTQEELEAAVAQWLKTTIARLEREKSEGLRGSGHPEVHVRARFVTGR
ncbi:MAG TPA: hypothetical protein VFN26_02440 [Candidatus Acidoferrum sp.]|nr:hypothetical protein [Candidatus Acidoferrum sp.]